MFLRCSYFSGDFSLDVLIKGVLIKKKGVSQNRLKPAQNYLMLKFLLYARQPLLD